MSIQSFPALGRLVGPASIAEFKSQRLERMPYLSLAPEPISTQKLISIEDIDHFFATIKYRTSECFCVDGNSPIDVSEFSSKGVVDSRQALSLFDQGATIVLNRVHLYHPPLADFCSQLAMELSAPCQANVYLTPPESKGFNLHYDTHDVFMAQVDGAKRWRVYESLIDLPLASQGTSASLKATGEPFLDSEMNPGDVLYIPRGWTHEGCTANSISLHLTFGIYFFTWADVISEAISQSLLQSKEFRSALPLDFLYNEDNEPEIRTMVGNMLGSIASEVDATSLKRAFEGQFRAQLPASTAGFLKQLILAREVNDSTKIRAFVKPVWRLEQDSTLVIQVPRGGLRIKEEGREAALACLSGRTTAVGSLSAWLLPDARLDLVQRLVAAGLVEVIE